MIKKKSLSKNKMAAATCLSKSASRDNNIVDISFQTSGPQALHTPINIVKVQNSNLTNIKHK